MFEGTQYWWTYLINGFVGLWVHGQGWYAPLYYGCLFGLAYFIRERMNWTEEKSLVLFVVGISLMHGGVVAILVLLLFSLMGGWLFGVPAILLAIYGLRKVVGSLRHTINNRAELAQSLLIKGGSSLGLVLAFVVFSSYQMGAMH